MSVYVIREAVLSRIAFGAKCIVQSAGGGRVFCRCP
jgi:hypothetical protein